MKDERERDDKENERSLQTMENKGWKLNINSFIIYK